MARTRQKAKQRKAKRREEEQKATQREVGTRERAVPADDAPAGPALAEDGAAELERRVDKAETATQEAPPKRPPKREQKAAPAKPARPPRRRDARAERKREPRQRGRFLNFLVQVWAELRRVQWPDRNQVTQATGVVVVFCLIAGAYLALWDFIFNRLVKVLL